MHELDDAKDQTMTALKVALANLAMWVRDRYSPADYAHATWARLAPFFRLPGRVVPGPDRLAVELRPFNDRGLNRDLAGLCARVSTTPPRLPDGRRLALVVRGSATLPPPAAGAGGGLRGTCARVGGQRHDLGREPGARAREAVAVSP